MKSSQLEFGFELLIAISIALLPWDINLNSKLMILLFSISFIDALFFKKEIKSFPFKRAKFIFIPYLIFILSLIWSNNISGSIKELTSTVSFIAIPFIFIYSKKYYTFNYHIVFIVFILSIITKFSVFFIDLLDFHPEALFSITYWKTVLVRLNGLLNEKGLHPTYYSIFVGISIYLAFYLSNKSKRKIISLFWKSIAFILFILMLAIMAKMPIVSLIVSLIVISVLSIKKNINKKRIYQYSIGLIIIILSIGFYLYKVPNSFIQDYKNYKNLLLNKNMSDTYDYSKYGSYSQLESWKNTNRLFIWQSAIQLWKNNWDIGTGIANYKLELNKQYNKNGYTLLSKHNMNTHNQYLSYLVKYGLFGFIILFCLLKLVVQAYKTNSYLFIGIIAFMFCTFFTENVLERQWGIVCFIFFYSLLMNQYEVNPSNLVDKG